MKHLPFIGAAHDDLSNFPDDVRRAAGYELWQRYKQIGG